MKKFKYSARDKAGKEVAGEIEARDELSVADILHDRGLVVVSVKENSFDLQRLAEINIGGIPMKEKVVFMRQMATMIGAGLSLTKSLEIMIQQSGNKMFQRTLKSVLDSVQSGKPLSVAFREQEDVFDSITLNLIEAGEESGNLDVVLDKLATELEEKDALNRKIRSAMIYPTIILLVIIAVVLMMMFILVPAMSDIYNDFDAELPWVTRALMSLSDFFIKYWWGILLVLVLLFVGFKYYRSTEQGRKTTDKLLLKIPIFGNIVSKIQLSQFTRVLALLLSSGLSIIKALELTAESLNNTVFKDVVLSARTEVEKGGPIAIPIARSEYFPLLVSSMMSVGEETGELDAVLNKVADYYKEEVDNATTNLSSALEPMFLVIMGLAVGFIALSVYLPMFQLSQVMG
ncbi:TPA: type II secretion system F family protein [Candidatus Dojkabacteria bacterium]|uniref:Type II secretion system F family protein n=1 Tax=Candidatus Dojkabacteria bacterium TaxID=2099670 RepID=A0A832QCZ5_9BACT|nr:type II secretion system F family protein [Candidatus Dojkabacteria bacterium]